MKDAKQEIIDAIEFSMHMAKGVEGVFEKIQFENLSGYICPAVDFEEFNSVGMSRLEESQVDDTIKQIIELYSSSGLTKVAWVLSPQSKPSNLVEKLESNGFKMEIPVLGMYRPIEKEFEFDVTDEFEFKEYNLDETLQLFEDPVNCRIYERAYGMPEGAADIVKLMSSAYKGLELATFVAYDKTNKNPAGYASIIYVPGTKICLLGGAATLPEYRGRGVYSAMLKLRHKKAKKDGMENLIVQAKESTSAPIAAKNGFKQVCKLPFYVWRKEQ